RVGFGQILRACRFVYQGSFAQRYSRRFAAPHASQVTLIGSKAAETRSGGDRTPSLVSTSYLCGTFLAAENACWSCVSARTIFFLRIPRFVSSQAGEIRPRWP